MVAVGLNYGGIVNDVGLSTTGMRELSLFSGAGGGLLATTHLLGFRTVCYVEWDDYCIDVLKARIKDGYLHDAPVWDNVQTFDGHPWAGQVDLLTAGFPCQPFSGAGTQLGEDDPRNMWPHTIRIVRESKPKLVFLENVSGIISSGYILTVLGDLAQAGYAAFPPLRLAASDVGANHKRERIWIMAYAKNYGAEWRTRKPSNNSEKIEYWRPICNRSDCHGGSKDVSNPNRTRLAQREGQRENPQQKQPSAIGTNRPTREWWQTEPRLGRVVDELADRVDRVKAIGNGQVPLQAAVAFRLLAERHFENDE